MSDPHLPRKYTYSEIFNSIQGEGYYTGSHTLWIRFFGCNLQCNGFGQLDPSDPESYELPYKDYDLEGIEKVEDLPVWEKGCDSSYTWSSKFKHLMKQATAKEIVKKINEVAITDTNPIGGFYHPRSKQTAHLCITGGEPLMRSAQKCVIEMNEEWDYLITPKCITWETNGTQKLSTEFTDYLLDRNKWNIPVFFSVSPKLWTVAGEKRERAIKPKVVKDYYNLGNIVNRRTSIGSPSGQLKFVLGSKREQWNEMEEVLQLYRDEGIDWPVYIMPVGATVEEQEASAGKIAKMAYERGYNVSGRLHCYLFGNAIGT